MDRAEARAMATSHLNRMRELPYAQLKRLVDKNPVETIEESGPSGVRYCLEIETCWDGKAGGDIRVFVAIDDGGLSALHPLSLDFIKAPDGSFVGE